MQLRLFDVRSRDAVTTKMIHVRLNALIEDLVEVRLFQEELWLFQRRRSGNRIERLRKCLRGLGERHREDADGCRRDVHFAHRI